MICGCADGGVRVFDRRSTPRFQHIMSFNEHKGWVVNVAIPHGTDNIVRPRALFTN